MKFKFKECVRELTLKEAVSFIQINRLVNYKDVLIELSAFDDVDNSFVYVTYQGKMTLFLTACSLVRLLKSLHFFVHHKWLFKHECVGFVHCVYDKYTK